MDFIQRQRKEMINTWADLNFFQSGEWDVIQEKLDDLDEKKIVYNPARTDLFVALDETDPGKVRVVVMGQDPYPTHNHACGIGFSVPDTASKATGIPATLFNIFKEYQADLHYNPPKTTDLRKWVKQDILMLNAILTCENGKSMSHASWTEWTYLNKEIIEVLNERGGVVFCFLGTVAKQYQQYVKDLVKNRVIFVSHPSPRAVKFSKVPFIGSRFFSTVNSKLRELNLPPIDWCLDEDRPKNNPKDAVSKFIAEKTATPVVQLPKTYTSTRAASVS